MTIKYIIERVIPVFTLHSLTTVIRQYMVRMESISFAGLNPVAKLFLVKVNDSFIFLVLRRVKIYYGS